MPNTSTQGVNEISQAFAVETPVQRLKPTAVKKTTQMVIKLSAVAQAAQGSPALACSKSAFNDKGCSSVEGNWLLGAIRITTKAAMDAKTPTKLAQAENENH